MALFKILRGQKANLINAEKQDGWAYFTPDTKGFYIQADDQLLKINDRVEIHNFTLTNDMLKNMGGTRIDIGDWGLENTSIDSSNFLIEIDFDNNCVALEDAKFVYRAILSQANLAYTIAGKNLLSIVPTAPIDERFTGDIPVIIKFIPFEKEME